MADDDDFPSEKARLAYEEAERQIEAWRAKGDKHGVLDLSGFGNRTLSALDRFPSSISGLQNLQNLILNGTQVSDLSPISNLQNLRTLDLTRTQISDLSPISGLQNLSGLLLSNTQVNDLTPLDGLQDLQMLTLFSTQISDLNSIKGLQSLQILYLGDTKVRDLTSVGSSQNLLGLHVGNTKVSDLKPLSDLRAMAEWAASDSKYQGAYGLFFQNCPNLPDPYQAIAEIDADKKRTLAALNQIRKDAGLNSVEEWLAGEEQHPQRKQSMSAFILEYLRSRADPSSIDEIEFAFESAGYDKTRASIRGRLNTLTSQKKILRVGRGLYSAKPKEDWPEPIEFAASPFKYQWNTEGLISLAGDAFGRISTPDNRSSDDAKKRLEAARDAATSLTSAIKDGKFQVGGEYADLLSSYADKLPDDEHGNIYLADMDLRTLRDDLEDDLKCGFVNERFARRARRVIEAHYGLRVYYPDLLNFYDDVKAGRVTEPPPEAAMTALGDIVEEFTPDVFAPDVSNSLSELNSNDTVERPPSFNSSEGDEAGVNIDLPPDPISDVDPTRANQNAKAGALNRIWKTLRRAEDGAKNIQRVEKAANTYAKHIEPVLEYLAKILGS